MQEFAQKLKERYASLPPELQEAIRSVDFMQKMQVIANRYGLRVDQGGEFEKETLFVMLGISRARDYLNNLRNSLKGLPEAKIAAIANDANELIFRTVKEALVKIGAANDESGYESFSAGSSIAIGGESGEKTAGIRPEPRVSAPPANLPTEDKAPSPAPQTIPRVPKMTSIPISPSMPVKPISPAAPAAPVSPKQNTLTPNRTNPLPAVSSPHPLSVVNEKLRSVLASSRSRSEIAMAPNGSPAIPSNSKSPAPPKTGYTVDPYREPIN